MAPPLHGIRVLEFATGVAGPIAAHILGDMGAEVIKVEAPWSRGHGPANVQPLRPGAPDRPYNRSTLFNELNRSKLSISLSVGAVAGRDLFLRLVGISDLVIENFAPRVMTNLGLTFEVLCGARQDIIALSMPAFGRTGPLRDFISYGPGIDAMSSLAYLTGYGDGRPIKPGNFYCDQNAGLLGALAALSALHDRRRTGQGSYVECAMLEGELQLVADALTDYSVNGRRQQAMANRHNSMAPHGVYRCVGDDSWVAIAISSDEQWKATCAVMGRSGLADDERFGNVAARYRNQDDLDDVIEDWTSHLDHYEVMHRLQAVGVPCGAVLNPQELLADPHVRARDYFQFVDQPESGPVPYPRVAFQLSRASTRLETPAPTFAEHNDYVFRDLLGLQDDELQALLRDGVITYEPAEVPA